MGRRRQPLPRLLRRHPHDDQRPRVPEVVDARARAGRQDAAHLDAVPQRADDRAGGEARRRCRASPTPRCSSRRRAPRRTKRRLLAATSYRRSNQVLALRNSYHGRSFGTIAITPTGRGRRRACRACRCRSCRAVTGCAARSATLDDDAYTAACVQDLRDVVDMCTSGDVACMIAEPIQGVGGFATPPDGFFGAMQKVLGGVRHPVHRRRGADRLRSHRRPLLGLPGARHRCPTSSRSRRVSATGSPSAR